MILLEVGIVDGQGEGDVDLRERYQGLCDGVLYAAETAEDMYRLGGIDNLLVPRLRETVERLRPLVDSADSRRDLAEDAARLIRLGHDYLELRRSLFGDMTWLGPEPPWRIFGKGPTALAVRARKTVIARDLPAYLLARATADADGRESWSFTILDRPAWANEPGRTWTVSLFGEPDSGERTLHAPPDIEERRTEYQELLYGFHALGITVRPGMLFQLDR